MPQQHSHESDKHRHQTGLTYQVAMSPNTSSHLTLNLASLIGTLLSLYVCADMPTCEYLFRKHGVIVLYVGLHVYMHAHVYMYTHRPASSLLGLPLESNGTLICRAHVPKGTVGPWCLESKPKVMGPWAHTYPSSTQGPWAHGPWLTGRVFGDGRWFPSQAGLGGRENSESKSSRAEKPFSSPS